MIKTNREKGENMGEQLWEAKKLTAGKLFASVNVRVGENVFQIRKENGEKLAVDNNNKSTKIRETSMCQWWQLRWNSLPVVSTPCFTPTKNQ